MEIKFKFAYFKEIVWINLKTLNMIFKTIKTHVLLLIFKIDMLMHSYCLNPQALSFSYKLKVDVRPACGGSNKYNTRKSSNNRF